MIHMRRMLVHVNVDLHFGLDLTMLSSVCVIRTFVNQQSLQKASHDPPEWLNLTLNNKTKVLSRDRTLWSGP